MARNFDVNAASSRFQLPLLTRQQIQALMLDLDDDARTIIIIAVQQLWQREIGEPERNVLEELDELRRRLEQIEMK